MYMLYYSLCQIDKEKGHGLGTWALKAVHDLFVLLGKNSDMQKNVTLR